MPYINKDRRKELAECNDGETAGELNYLLTTVIHHYILDNGLTYQIINDVIGALEGAKLEFYRRIVVPYEDRKIIENGDVYDA